MIASLVMLLILTIIFLHFHPNNVIHPKAAIIDQLGSSLLEKPIRYPNQTFLETARKLLYKKFSTVDYYSDNATVDEYKNIASKGYKLIIWRAHSALNLDPKFIAISTVERYNSKKYYEYMANGQLTLCNLSGYLYFGITPQFITEVMNGRFDDTVIILMSCNGLKKGYHETAETFKEKGVKAVISWDGWIHPRDNDNSIILLLNYLLADNRTIGTAVNEVPERVSEFGWTRLYYYPTTSDVENYIIPNYRENKSTSTAYLIIRFIAKEEYLNLIN